MKDKWNARKDLISETRAASSLSRPSVLSSQNSTSLWTLASSATSWSTQKDGNWRVEVRTFTIDEWRVSNSLQNSNLLAQEWIWASRRILKLCTNSTWEDDFLIFFNSTVSKSESGHCQISLIKHLKTPLSISFSFSWPSVAIWAWHVQQSKLWWQPCDVWRIAKDSANLWHTKPTPATDSCSKIR